VTRHVIPDDVLTRPESLAEVEPLAHLPETPFAFIWFLVRKHFARRVAVLVSLAAVATAIDAFGPLALSHLINAIGHAYLKHLSFTAAVLPWIGLMGAIWFVSATVYRGYEAVDIETSPRMRALAQKYLFVYMLGHSPRYFQENFAGKLGQKVKQAGQATVAILNILCLDMVRVSGLVLVGGVLMFEAKATYAAILFLWTVITSASSFRSRNAACGCRRRSPTKSPRPPGGSWMRSAMPISCAPSRRRPMSGAFCRSSSPTK
jgi:ATP-binding cassette subfamily B protein